MEQIHIHPKCNCTKGIQSDLCNQSIKSTCPMANFRGPVQNVVSFSFYGNLSTSYFQGIAVNCELIPMFYPNWTVRVYHNINPNDQQRMKFLCQQVCKYPYLDECYVGDIADQYENIVNKFGMLWRFLVLGDATVHKFVVRDLDSDINQRELDAVNDWIVTGKTWHVMRDHYQHINVILGGMWGAKNKNVSMMQTLCKNVFSSSNSSHKQHDQDLLETVVWPVARLDMVAHDSFQCLNYNDTKPWPTQRVERHFVGSFRSSSIDKECPAACRPIDHQDWIYC